MAWAVIHCTSQAGSTACQLSVCRQGGQPGRGWRGRAAGDGAADENGSECRIHPAGGLSRSCTHRMGCSSSNRSSGSCAVWRWQGHAPMHGWSQSRWPAMNGPPKSPDPPGPPTRSCMHAGGAQEDGHHSTVRRQATGAAAAARHVDTAQYSVPGLPGVCRVLVRVEALLAGGDEVVGVHGLGVASHLVVPAGKGRAGRAMYRQRIAKRSCRVLQSLWFPPAHRNLHAHQAAMVPLGQPLQRGLTQRRVSEGGTTA